jgi:hypothetical protein
MFQIKIAPAHNLGVMFGTEFEISHFELSSTGDPQDTRVNLTITIPVVSFAQMLDQNTNMADRTDCLAFSIVELSDD